MEKYIMNYDCDRDQWLIELQDRKYALHCGESFKLLMGRKPTPCRLELAEKWYIVIGAVSFDLRENVQYTIQL